MKYVVRYEVEGFVVKEKFKDYESADKYYDSIAEQLQDYLLNIDLYEI